MFFSEGTDEEGTEKLAGKRLLRQIEAEMIIKVYFMDIYYGYAKLIQWIFFLLNVLTVNAKEVFFSIDFQINKLIYKLFLKFNKNRSAVNIFIAIL